MPSKPERTRLFINYRRDDSLATAGRLYDRLSTVFGKENVFMDVDRIPIGDDFFQHITAQIAQCHVMIVVIGDKWVDLRDSNGLRRINDPSDVVALEIGTALARRIPILPVLVDEIKMPSPSELPANLKALLFRNAINIRNTNFKSDYFKLLRGLRPYLPDSKNSIVWPKLIFLGTVLALLTAGVVLNFEQLMEILASNSQGVEACTPALEPTVPGMFSGLFVGVADDGDKTAQVQIKLVRNGDIVHGYYFRAGICGLVRGEIKENRFAFQWRWADADGRGLAIQEGGKLVGTSGYKDAVAGSASFVLYQK